MGAISNARGAGTFNDGAGLLPLSLLADRLTIVGSGAGQSAIFVQGNVGTEHATGSITNSVLLTTGAGAADLQCVQGVGGTAAMNVQYSMFDPARVLQAGTCAPTSSHNLSSVLSPPGFVNAAQGDYRPVHDSPVVDAGDPAAEPFDDLVDLFGNQRVVDGDGTDGARVDMGANEYQNLTPSNLAPSQPAGPLRRAAAAKHSVTISWGASTDDDGAPTTYLVFQRKGTRWVQVATVYGHQTYKRGHLRARHGYRFAVCAVDAIGNQSTLLVGKTMRTRG